MANYTVNMLNQAGWLVYINGLEIPVSSLSMRYGVWELPTLTLNMVPHNLLVQIGAEDRLQVAVFYLDQHWESNNPQFCLLGEFEVVGWSYNNTPRGRFISLNCVSQLQIFQQLHFFYISSLDDIVTSSSPVESTNPGSASVVKVLYPASLFREGLTSPQTVQEEGTSATATVDVDSYIKRPIDFVTNIFRALLRPISTEPTDEFMVDAGSEALPRSACSVPGKNFFARWLNMTRFHRRWAALPILEDEGESGCFPLVKATQDTVTLSVLDQQIGQGVGNSGSAWDLLKQVLGYMYMEISVLPAPPAALTHKKTGVIEAPAATLAASSAQVDSIPTFFVKPMCTFALPPACNVVFPSMVRNYSFQENYIRQPTRIYLSEQFIGDIISPAKAGTPNFVQQLMVTGYPEGVRKRMKDRLDSSPQTNHKNFLLFEEEFFKGPITKRMNAPPWMYLLQQQENAYQTAQSQAEAETEEFVADEIVADSPLGALFDTYAKYEYFRARYAERSGGVILAWNPYIVPGFPLAVFDQRSAGFDTLGYVNTVTHNMSAQGEGVMDTSVSLTFMRTLPEFVGLFTENEHNLDVLPSEVIPEIRDAFQVAYTANDFYKRLLYQDASMSKSAVFDWKQMCDIQDRYGTTLDLATEAWKLEPTVTLKPKGEFSALFDQYDAAMRYASRPVCTLQEYIERWHGRALESLLEDGTVRGEYTSFYSPTNDKKKTKGAVFWGRIYKLMQGPGDDPGVGVSNMGIGPDYDSAGTEGGWQTVDENTGMAQTRQDWDARLEEYRKIVRSEEGRIAPQE